MYHALADVPPASPVDGIATGLVCVLIILVVVAAAAVVIVVLLRRKK